MTKARHEKFDFDKVINRRNTASLKWDASQNGLPMWVADMDFETAPEIQNAILDRAAHGIYGYTNIQDMWYQAYIDWWRSRHHFIMEEE